MPCAEIRHYITRYSLTDGCNQPIKCHDISTDTSIEYLHVPNVVKVGKTNITK